MIKLKRTKKDYGGGGGRTTFESDFFRVVLWTHGRDNGKRTELEVKTGDFGICLEVYFDGHHEFKSENDCFDQLTSKEIVTLINGQKKLSFENGKKHKIIEIRGCLNC